MKPDSDRRATAIQRLLSTKPSAFWERLRERRTLELFHRAAEGVPAYRDFLRRHQINHAKIKSWADFQQVPIINKKNYLRHYPLPALCWGGTLKRPLVFTATSGSTGEPVYFPRGEALDWQYSIIVETFLRQSRSGGPVLVIVGFGMGVWIGGLITYRAFEIAAARLGYPLSIITPGINKEEIFNAFRRLAPHYRQTILIGYPPFIKDIIDEAPERGIKLKQLNLRLWFAAEAFSETFRDYLAQRGGVQSCYRGTINIYGSADIGAMAYESNVSIMVKRLARRRPRLFTSLFSAINKTPTLAQYHPLFINFEAPGGEIVLTGDNALPLVRYAIGDHGGVFSFAEMEERLAGAGVRLSAELRAAGFSRASIAALPFVYVYERSDFSATIYGLQVYPETIREVLADKSWAPYFTGKLTMRTEFDSRQNQFLEINVERRKNRVAPPALRRKLIAAILQNLQRKNSEFRELVKYVQGRPLVQLAVWPAEHPQYFRPGVKQRWVEK
ncbi:MAG: phenylacetate--CoA ligase family protein [Candidatus Magasanikbacteria bacterium]|nr:phenylacetate--CoA ligase family protein [Candidatus Magasanikbacteria bacterium]